MHEGCRSSHPGQSRIVVIADLGRVPQMPLDAMMEMVMHSLLSNEQVDAILEELSNSGVIANGTWRAFDPKPSLYSETESKVFNQRLPKLRRNIVNSTYRVTNLPTTPVTGTELRMSGSQTPFSERKNTSRPDGYYVRHAPRVGLDNIEIGIEGIAPEWRHIALPIEVKKRSTKGSVEDVCLSCQYPPSD